MFYAIWVASQQFHGKESLTYESVDPLSVGQLVAVQLQRKTVIGIVQSEVSKPSFATKPIAYSWPFQVPKLSLELLSWLQNYYPAPLGLITELFTPPSLPKKIPEIISPSALARPVTLPPLTAEQLEALHTIQEAPTKNVLLHGDTGTGKTRIYLELTKKALDEGKSAIILTPEIGLTEPLVETFRKTFGDVVVTTHSGMTPAQRRTVWLTSCQATQGIVVIGPRSALFAPLQRLGLLVIDEVHDSAYKQEQAPYYQTSRVAAKLAQLHSAHFVMGSATPPVADYFTFEQKRLPIIRMTEPATGVKQQSLVEIIDQRDKEQFKRSPWLATKLLNSLEEALKNDEQSLLFLNRRGSSRLVLCEQCGWQARCPHCDVALTYHEDQHAMRCHSCDFKDRVPTNCPECGKSELIFRSIGTKALEGEMNRLFPRARISRFDRDTHKSIGLTSQYAALHAGEIDIVIGTQSIAKGFDLPKLTVVGIVQADSGLLMPDYTASERTYQLISQVAGRISRGHRPGKLVVQTYNPDSELIKLALQKDYASFYGQELRQRQLYNFPPFAFLLKITCARASSKSAREACQKIAELIKGSGLRLAVEGPAPRFIEKIAGRYAWHLVVKSKNRSSLVQIISILPANCTYDLDPSDLL